MQDRDPRPDCIVVADGEVLVRNAIADYLRSCGYRVIEAASSGEVVAVLGADGPPVDAVLCDAALPGESNAFELRLWLREHRPEVHVVLAGNAEAAAKAAGKLCDDGPHLQRPYEPDAVANHIKRLLARVRDGRD